MNRTFTTVPVKATPFGWMVVIVILLIACFCWADQLLAQLLTGIILVSNLMPILASFVKINLGMLLVGGLGAVIPAVILGKICRSDRVGYTLLVVACVGCLTTHYRAHFGLTPIRQQYMAEITTLYQVHSASDLDLDPDGVDRIVEERDNWLTQRGYIGLGKWSVKDGQPVTDMGYIYVTPIISGFLSSRS